MTKEEQRWMFPRSRYRHLLENERFSASIENVSRGPKVNAEVSLRRIGLVCNLFQIAQSDLAKMSRGEAGDFLFRVVSRLEKKFDFMKMDCEGCESVLFGTCLPFPCVLETHKGATAEFLKMGFTALKSEANTALVTNVRD